MSEVRRGLTLLGLVLAIVVKVLAQGTVPLTTVQDTVYNAEGQPASGTVLVSWSAFTTAGGSAVPAGNTSVTIGANGLLTVALAPNAGGTPMGSYYTAVFHLNDGTVSREYWVIPVAVPGGGPAKLAAIENQVLPTSVAMQTVSKAYVDNAIAAAETGFVTSASPYVLKAGDTMTGPLVLPADPVNPTQAADKNYVDENVAAIAAGLGQKVSLLPSGGQVVAQPSGTTLGVNLLNGEVYASQYASGSGNNGIRNALGSADCASGCVLNVEHNYGSTEQVSPVELPSGTAVLDTRDGTLAETVANPLAVVGAGSAAQSITQVETMSPVQLEAARPGSLGVGAYAMTLNQNALAGGSNLFPNNIETPPYFKNTYGALALTGVYNTQGQHVQLGNQVNCYGVGDCIGGTTYITSSGGYRDNGDEGTHPADLSVAEDVRVFEGSCTTGCTTGATSLTVTTTANAGTQGDGRFLIDVNPAKTIGTGTITGGSSGIFGTASFSGTSFPVSVLLQTTQAAMSQAANMAPGTVTLGIATSGVAAGFATSTVALPASSGVACVADETNTPNYEMASYSVVDGSHLQLTLNKPHLAGAAVAVGGLCGYGLEQKADTRNGIRQVFPVVASTSATSLYYADAGVFIVGYRGVGSTSGFLNVSAGIAGISRSANVVTVTTSGLPAGDPTGLTFTVSGVADPSYNGSFVVTTTSANTLTYANAGADSTSSGGTLSYTNGAYALYPMAEVLSVFDAGSGQVDGSFTLAPNTVAWAAGDAVEEPHYYKQATFADTEAVTQYVPRPIQFSGAGKVFYGQAGPGLRGWEINNGVPASNYLGGGGTYSLPDDAYVVSGAWTNDFELTAGASDVMKIHCNLHACGRWDSGYNLFDLDAGVGEDTLTYFPQSNAATWTLGGAQYAFAPSGFTAGTINVGTLNATTITGGVSGGAITSGTVSAARLPLFGPSGTSHAAGIVPDPGATAGATRYLREDGTWSVPAGGSGGGGSPSGTAGGNLSGSYPNPEVIQMTGNTALQSVASGGGLQNSTVGSATQSAAYGYQALLAQTTGYNNDAFGWNAMVNNTTGHWNNAMGHDALNANHTGSSETAIGEGAMYTWVSGDGNTCVGASCAIFIPSTGTQNTLVGANVVSVPTSGSINYDTVVGYNAGANLISDGNTLIGTNAGASLTTGNHNTIIGLNAANGNLTTGSYNILLCSGAFTCTTPASNTIEFMNLGNVIFATNISTAGAAATVGINTVTPNTAYALDVNGGVRGSTISVASARKGTFTCTAGGTITIANTNELATSDVVISLNAAGGTITTPPAMNTVTAGTGFSVLCGANDTSMYNYDILN